MALAVAPFAAQAETWNIYGWQNHSWEFIDIDGGRSFDRTQSNAGNIGFAASVPTGMNDLSVNVQCEQFTFYNHFGGFGDWCNRNSKIGLSHPMMGEIMMATWLLPYNEGVAQWVDPFYDAGADSHTSIMGSVGAGGTFYNAGFSFAGPAHLSFNRRQENIIQYWSPNWNGFVFRFAWTVGNADETNNKKGASGGTEIDPVIRSSSLAYTNGPFWAAVTWQDHEDWTAQHVGEMDTSDAESIRVAGRYIMDMGDGMSLQVSAMYEDLEYEFNGVTSVEKAMTAFGYSNFGMSGNLMASAKDNPPGEFMAPDDSAREKLKYKTIGLLYKETGALSADGTTAGTLPAVHMYTKTVDGDTVVTYGRTAEDDDDDTTGAPVAAPPRTAFNEHVNIYTPTGVADNPETMDTDESIHANAVALETYLNAWGAAVEAIKNSDDMDEDDMAYVEMYNSFVDAADKLALPAVVEAAETAHAMDVKNYTPPTAGGSVKIERDAWMISGKIKFGGPVDFRFSYMDADDLEVSCGSACRGDWDETAAEAWNVGMFYTMPAGTELRLTYSEVDNDDNASYDFGIGTLGMKAGQSAEMFAVGIVHWFD